MSVFQTRWIKNLVWLVLICAISLVGASAALGQSQSAAADLNGTVKDTQGGAIRGASVTVRNKATNATRTVTTNDEGVYTLTTLPPGEYELTVEASNFKKAIVTSLILTVGQTATLDVPLEVGETTASVDITGTASDIIEASRTTVANTIDQQRINNLPINERSATGFALTISTVGRDNGRPVGPAPTSGLNIGGQRGRSTLVQVDGSDFTDNSVNAARSTVSQEAVQEYQVATNSYAAEFGRAIGGIVNVVTKGGTNELHGNVFGFFRHKTIQARNAFAPIIDNDPDKKPPFTRGQYGLTLGGPFAKDRTFFFFSFEQRRRQESGFFTGDIIGGLTSSVTIPVIAGLNPVARTFTNLTAGQANYISTALQTADPQTICFARAYAFFASSGGTTALNGTNPLTTPNDGSQCPAISPILPTPSPVIGGRFILSGALVPTPENNGRIPGFTTVNEQGQPIGFRALSRLSRVFPISESTTFNSFRLDHKITEGNQLSVRLGYNPSEIVGIQDESQNQTLGQNDFSRTGIQKLQDYSFATSLNSILSDNVVNEAYFNFGLRKANFDSRVPGAAIQIAGTAFIGANPFSPVDRRERRLQFRDNINIVAGNHNFKFGGDVNDVRIEARFDLNFPGLFNFGQQAGGSLISNPVTRVACDSATIAQSLRCPAFTPIQTYGLGFPGVFIQGFGDPFSSIDNTPISLFAQDSWKIRKNFTLNYGVRYDVELTDTIAPVGFRDPLTGIALSQQDVQTTQDALNVQQGFPRDKNNIAPRLGLSWDITGDSKTVIRAAYGLFYDHPLLAVAFNSDIADGSQQQQSTLLPFGGPSPAALFNAFQVFQGTAIPGVTPGLAPSARYLNGQLRFDPSAFTGFGPVLPFTLHVGKDFEYAYATQGNLSIERQLTKDMSVSASYINVNARHLPHPQDVNAPRTDFLVENFRRFAGRAPNTFTEAAFFTIPLASPAYTVLVPSGSAQLGALVARNNTTGAIIVNPIAANFFRPLSPNYFFVATATGGLITPAAFNAALAGSLRTPGPISSYGEVNAQLSDGNSSYNALNVELKKRFSNDIQIFGTYTWAHSIDDSSDLQTLLKPQNNRNFRAEKADSLFDQRHRFVFSGFVSAPGDWRGSESLWKRVFADFTVAPIVEVSSGRPFNILAIQDANGDLQSSNERPSVLADGTLCAPQNTAPGDPNDPPCFTGFPLDGNLGRNRGITHSFFTVDLRLSRKIRFGERFSLDLIGEGFNLFNRFNEAAASPFFRDVNAFGERAGGKYFSRPTAAFDPRQFQLGIKLNF